MIATWSLTWMRYKWLWHASLSTTGLSVHFYISFLQPFHKKGSASGMRYRSVVLLLLLIELHSSSCTHLVIPCILRVLYNGEGRFMTRIFNNSGQRQLQPFYLYYFVRLLHKVNEIKHNTMPCLAACPSRQLLKMFRWKLILFGINGSVSGE